MLISPERQGFRPGVSLLLAGVVTVAACGSDSRPATSFDPDQPSTVMSEMGSAVPVGGAVTLIGEEDFLEALETDRPLNGSRGGLETATRVAALVNSPSALGVFSAIDPRRTSFSGDVFIVVRDPSPGHGAGFVEARNFYLANVRLSGRARWIGRAPHVALETDMPMPARGSCGLLEAPGSRLPCPGPNCPPEAFRMGLSSSQGEPGGGGVLGTASVPLHVFDATGYSLWLCQPFEFSPPNRPIPDVGLGSGRESCNGLDDDEDGAIDEGNVCANRNAGCRTAALAPSSGLAGSPSCEGGSR